MRTRSLLLVLIPPLLVSGTPPQTSQTTWAALTLTYTGEHTVLLPGVVDSPSLTPLGAQQALLAGSAIRTRYLAGPGTNVTDSYPIQGLSQQVLDNTQTSAVATNQQWSVATAQAFMQGLYPPVSAPLDSSALANGSLVRAPLGGYQYAAIQSMSRNDFDYIWLDGTDQCQNYASSAQAYQSSSSYRETSLLAAPFYAPVAPAFSNILAPSQVSYMNARVLYQYAAYQSQHNSSYSSTLFNLAPNNKPLALLRHFASTSAFALAGNLTADGGIRGIAGRTLAGRVLYLLAVSLSTLPASALKLSVLFPSSATPFLSFFSISGLSAAYPDVFTSLSAWGATLAFEVFSYGTNASFPRNADELFVRFLFRNGTADTDELRAWPLFGRGTTQSEVDMRWTDFVELMNAPGVALQDPGQWCSICGSTALWCGAFANSPVRPTPGRGGASPAPGSGNGVSAPVAGVIGAAVTLAVLLLGSIVAWFLGVGLRREGPGPFRKTSASGGFKGAEKLGSDLDVSVIKGTGSGAGVGATVIRHERLGSWELREAREEREEREDLGREVRVEERI